MSWRASIRGRAVQYDTNFMYVNGRIIGNDEVGFGKTFYVDSGVDASSGVNPDEAVGTLDEAFALCTADQGDKIVVMPNHAETITGVGGITADVAGVSVIGLGRGNQRPRFLMDGAATVTFVVSAADFYIENCVFAAGHADVVRCFHVTGAYFHAHELEFVENVITENFLIDFDATGSSANDNDGLRITNCLSIGVDTSRTEFIAIVENVSALHVVGNIVIQSLSTDGALIKQAGTKTLLGCFIAWNFVQSNTGDGADLLVDNGAAANTGIIAHNRVKHTDTTGAHLVADCDGVGLFDNLSVSTNILSGVVVPAIDVNL